MNKLDIVSSSIAEHLNVINALEKKDFENIQKVASLISKKLIEGNRVFWCGNGGSASDCQHLSAELVGRYKKDRKALNSISLTTDTSALTCIANDFSYSHVFSRQLEALGKSGDVLVAISTSGESENIISALKTSSNLDMISIGFLGKDGGSARKFCDHCLIVPSHTTARIQEIHILVGHIICEYIDYDYAN